MRSDGQHLLDLGRWLLLGRKSAWLAAATQPPADPHAAASVAPPG